MRLVALDRVRKPLEEGLHPLLVRAGVLGIERRHGREALRQQRRAGAEPVRGPLGRRAIEDGRVGVELGVPDPDGLEGRGQPVRIGVGHHEGALGRELADLHEPAAGGVRLAGGDVGRVAEQVPKGLVGSRDLLLAVVFRLGAAVVVPEDHGHALRLEPRHGGKEPLGRGSVDEDYAAGLAGQHLLHDLLRVGSGEDLGEDDDGGLGADEEHGSLIFFWNTPEIAEAREGE